MSNNKKTVVFLDDGPNMVNEVLKTIVKRLWKKDTSVLMFFLGDFEKKESNLIPGDFEKQLSNLKLSLLNEFTNFLIDTGRFSDSEALQYYHLINSHYQYDPDNINVDFNPEVNIVVDKNDEINEEIFNNFKSITEQIFTQYITEDGCFNNTEFVSDFSVNQIINTLELEKNTLILLDMCLLEGDLNKLECPVKNDKLNSNYIVPILSMALYHNLINNNYQVIMYTSYDFTTDMIKAWLKTYSFVYGNKDISFYNRIGKKLIGCGNDEIIKEIDEKLNG